MAFRCVVALSIFLVLIKLVISCEHCTEITRPGARGQMVVNDTISNLQAIMKGVIGKDVSVFLFRIACVESKFGTDKNTYRSGYHGGIWQVDEIAFNDTQDTGSHSKLSGKHKIILKICGIDWTMVTWKHLRKPLYSGMAALLFMSNKPFNIPDDLNGQAEYWKKYYNTASGSGTVQKFKDDVRGPDCM